MSDALYYEADTGDPDAFDAPLITEEYRRLNAELHERRPDYGVSGHKWARAVHSLAAQYGARDILDYGCGKETLARAMETSDYGAKCSARTGKRIVGYDPAIPGLDAPPEPADLVVCGDVLEHVEPECLDAVLDDLARLTKKVAFLVVATRLAKKTLADGRNAHLIVRPPQWWMPKIMARFHVKQYEWNGGEFAAVVEPK